MPDELTPRERPAPPAPIKALDRTAVERVLARAAELQAGQLDTGETQLTESQLLEIGREVGLSPQHLRQAMAEERGRIVLQPDEGWAGRLAGPAQAAAARTVAGSPERVMRLLLDWMQLEECLQVKRRFPDRTTWEPRRDFLGSVKRSFNIGGRGYMLARAEEVGATVLAVDDDRTLVQLNADFSPSRRARVAGAGATAAGGVIAGSAPLVLGAALIPDPTFIFYGVATLVAAIGAGGGVLGGLGVARTHRQVIMRAQLALEQILDRLEQSDDRDRPRTRVFDAAERLLRDTVGEISTRGPWPRSGK